MNTETDFVEKYITEERDNYRQFALKMKEILSSILESKAIVSQSINYREKDPEKLRKKIDKKDYHNPLQEITDLAGVRIITYFPSDVDKIVELIEDEFVIDHENSIDKRKSSDPSTFGYASYHLVVELSPERLNLPEYSFFKKMKCEIQVRTILQHAWAEIEHDIIYKSTEDIPFELRRRFSSLAGMLEVADREFESLRESEIEVRKEIGNKISRDVLNIPIDLESLSFYLKNNRNEKVIDAEKVSQLIKLLKIYKIETIQDFDRILTPELLSKADIDMKKITCELKIECLLHYFLVLGYHLEMDYDKIVNLVDCPDIKKLI